MEAKRICPYCMGELESRVSVCPHCGGVLAGRNPAGSLPVGTLLAGRYTVGEMQSIDGEGILYRGVENTGRFRVTIKEYMPLTLSAERGTDALLRPKLGSEVLFKTTRMDFAVSLPLHPAHHPRKRSGGRAGRVRGEQHRLRRDGESRRHPAAAVAG